MDQQKGTNKIKRIEFGEITSVNFDFNPPVSYSISNFLFLIKDIVDMPKHFKVHMTKYDDPLSLTDIGITNIDPNNWIDALIEEGVLFVDIYAQ